MEFFRHQNCFTLDGGISPFASSRLWHVICRQNEKFICNKTKPFSVRSGLAVGYFHIWRDKKNKIKLYTYNCNCSSKQSLLLWCKKYRYKGVFYYEFHDWLSEKKTKRFFYCNFFLIYSFPSKKVHGSATPARTRQNHFQQEKVW